MEEIGTDEAATSDDFRRLETDCYGGGVAEGWTAGVWVVQAGDLGRCECRNTPTLAFENEAEAMAL